MWVHRTKVGRIVYERKPTPFKCRDVARILSAISRSEDNYDHSEQWDCYFFVLHRVLTILTGSLFGIDERREKLVDRLQREIDSLKNEAESVEFGGGESGGGGASGEL